MTDRYPWYEVVEGEDLEQGDIIPACPCFLPIGNVAVGSKINFNWEERDLIVLSQSCDLVRGREKVTDVLLAAVWRPSDLSGHLATPKGLEDARRGNLPSVHLLAECLVGGVEPGVRVVDFRSVFTLPVVFLRDQARSSAK